MTIFLLIISGIAMSFMLPADIREQTIHTVVTKPVERFEIVLGRFLGFTALMTAVLFGMTLLSLLYVVRSIDPDAAAECLKAREPVYGDLTFEGTTKEDRGENVGMEWEYRSYISGPMPGQPPQYAIWTFDHPCPAGSKTARQSTASSRSPSIARQRARKTPVSAADSCSPRGVFREATRMLTSIAPSATRS